MSDLDNIVPKDLDQLVRDIMSVPYTKSRARKMIAEYIGTMFSRVDRFEVIDDTGRAYVKGSIYGSPVKIETSLQDDDRTLKVFVNDIISSNDL